MRFELNRPAKKCEILTPRYYEINGEAQPYAHLLHHYLDLEVTRENIEFLDGEKRLMEWIDQKVQNHFQQQKGIFHIKDDENTLCVDLKMVESVFGLSPIMSFRYLVAHYVLNKGQNIYLVNQNTNEINSKAPLRSLLCTVHIERLHDEKGLKVAVYNIQCGIEEFFDSVGSPIN